MVRSPVAAECTVERALYSGVPKPCRLAAQNGAGLQEAAARCQHVWVLRVQACQIAQREITYTRVVGIILEQSGEGIGIR